MPRRHDERHFSHAARARAPLAVLWTPRSLVASVLFGEALAAVLTLGADRPGWVFFGLASLAAQWIILLTLGLLYVLRGTLFRLPTALLPMAAFLSLIGITAAVLAVAARLLPLLATDIQGGWLALGARIVGIVGLVATLGMIALQNHWQARAFAVRTKQAELDLLQARIRPHFLFNTLNTAMALVHTRPDQAERVLLDLADLFRASLGKSSLVSLGEELDLTRRYLDIEKLRFAERLVVAWDVPDAVPLIAVPPLSIQPLVENAVRHGIEPSIDGGVVSLKLTIGDGFALIEIINEVSINSASAPATSGHGVGLRASIARIEDATAGLGSVVEMTENGRYVVRVRLPLTTALK